MGSLFPFGRAALLTLVLSGVSLWACALPRAARPVQQARGSRQARLARDLTRFCLRGHLTEPAEFRMAPEGKALSQIAGSPCADRVEPPSTAGLIVLFESRATELPALHLHPWTRPPPTHF